MMKKNYNTKYMIYIIITTSINNKAGVKDDIHRQHRYTECIKHVLGFIENDAEIKPIILENNGPRETYLNDLKCDVFYTDNKKNLDLKNDESPKMHQQGRGGYLACVSFDKKGEMKKHLLGEIDEFETNFFIRRFVKGDYDNLIYTARKRRRNSMISIGIQ